MEKVILIDGDILVYEMGFSVESPIYVVGGTMYKRKRVADKIADDKGLEVFKRKNVCSFDQVEINLKSKLTRVFDDLGTSNYKMYLTASRIKQNFRQDIATFLPYKGNRMQVEKPVYYKRIRKYLVEQYNAELVEGQEADDAIGIEQYRLKNETGSFEHTYIATIDKDLRMLEGYHYNLKSHYISYVDEETALKNFYGQLLKGDATDFIPGLTKLLKIHNREKESNSLSHYKYFSKFEQFALDHTAKQCYDYVVTKYKEFGFGERELNEIGQLLWIRRKEDEIWDMKNG